MGAAAMAIPMAMQGVGSIFQGIAGQGQTEAQRALAKQQMRDQEAQYANHLMSGMQEGGLRDQAIYQLMNNLGQSPHAFNPVNYGAPTNSGQQGTGGYDLNQEAQHASQYQPGMGGTNTNVAQATLGMLGYAPGSDIQTRNNPGSQSYSYAGNTYQNGTGPLGEQTKHLQSGYTLQSGATTPGTQNNPSGGSFTGQTYTPPGMPTAHAQSTVPGQFAGMSYGGGTSTPSGPGTSGAGQAGYGAQPGGGWHSPTDATSQWPSANRVQTGSTSPWGY